MKKIAIMQPYFLPYIGYFQLMDAVDEFVIYDNIQFSKRGWFHRNRILENGKDAFISLPIKKDSDYLDVRDRSLADSFDKDKLKIIAKIKNSYQKAPYFQDVMPLVDSIFQNEEKNLFDFIYFSVLNLRNYLGISTEIKISSTIDINHSLKSAEKVKSIVNKQKASVYLNPVGGLELYDKNEFRKEGIILKFLETRKFSYSQFSNEFIPFLSIVDVIMFNDKDSIKRILSDEYTLI